MDGPAVAPEHWSVPPKLNQSFGYLTVEGNGNALYLLYKVLI